MDPKQDLVGVHDALTTSVSYGLAVLFGLCGGTTASPFRVVSLLCVFIAAT